MRLASTPSSPPVVLADPWVTLENWHWIEPLLERIDTSESGFSTFDVLTKIQAGGFQCWIVPERAVAITTVTAFPQHSVCTVLQLAGDGLSEWFADIMACIEDFAREMGCKYVEEYGRKGWERVGKSLGYEYAFTVMRKQL